MMERLTSDWLPGIGSDPTRTSELRTEVYNTVRKIGERLQSPIAELAADVRAVCSQTQAAMIGRTDVLADSIRQTCGRITGKLEDGERRIASEMYAYWQHAGLPLPGNDSVSLYLASGDSVGAVLQSNPGVDWGVPNGSTPNAPIPIPPAGSLTPSVPIPPTSSGGSAGSRGIPEGNPPVFTPSQQGVTGSAQPACPPGFMPNPDIGGSVGEGSVCTTAQWCYIGGLPPPGESTLEYNQTNYPFTYVPSEPFSSSGCPIPPRPPGNLMGNWTVKFGPCDPGIPSWLRDARGPGEQSGPPELCLPMIVEGWTQQYFLDIDTNQQLYLTGQTQVAPWLDPNSTPPTFDADDICVPACHFVPSRPTDMCMQVPRGWSLYVLPGSNTVVASSVHREGYQPVGYLNTSGSGGGPGPTPPNQPPGGGGGPPACVPIPPGATCPEIPAAECKPHPAPPTVPGAPNDADICAEIANQLKKMREKLPNIKDTIAMSAEVATGSAKLQYGGLLTALLGSPADAVVPGLVNRFANWLQSVVEKAAKGLECDRAALVPVAIEQAVYGFIDQWTNAVPSQITTALEHLSNTACQSKLPSPADADNAWLLGAMNESEWECVHKAAGNFIGMAQSVVRAKRSRPDILQTISLWRREEIDRETMLDRLRKLGVIDETDREELVKLTEVILQAPDIIRLMVRDVWNAKAVEDARLDEGFKENFLDSEQAKKLAKAAGITHEQMRLLWRAHFQIPSYTMLREMIFRLRPGEVDAKLAIDREGMRRALIADDWAPGFVDRMIEIAYLPINRTDFTRLYMDHVIEDDELVKKYLSVGYKEADARELAKGLKVRRKINDYKTAGYPSLSVVARAYGKCELDDSTLVDAVETLSISDEQRAAAMEAAELHRTIHDRRVLIRSVTKEFRVGLIDAGEAGRRLSEGGIDPGCIPSLVRGMVAQRQRQSKYLAPTQLCKMLDQGIISAGEMVQALIRANWDMVDAQRIVTSCQFQIAERERKALEKAAKDAAKAAERERKRLEKEATATP